MEVAPVRDAAARWGAVLGIFPVTIGGKYDKRPAFPVKDMFTELRERPPTAEEIAMWWGQGQGFGLALHAGPGGYTCMDFDDATVYEPWREMVVQHGGEEILERLFVVKTRCGFHAWYRCPSDPQPVRGLAMWPEPTFDERRQKHTSTRIEIRGVGGYAILPPSKGYEHLSGPDLLELPEITSEEQELLISAATLFDEQPVPLGYVPVPQPKSGTQQSERPGDWFNRTADWRELIEEAGGRYDGSHGHRMHWTRPGKRHGTSLTTGNGTAGQDLAKVHTPNWAPFEVGMVKDKFGFYAVLNHGGDLRAAAQAVAKMPAFMEANPRSKRNDWDGSPPEGPPPPLDRLFKTSPTDELPHIQVNYRELREITADAVASLLKANDPPTIFARDGVIVRIEEDENNRFLIRRLAGKALRGRLARVADWVEYRKDKPVHVSPPMDVVDDILALGRVPRGIPPLAGIAASPVLSKRGTFHQFGGYDPDSRWFITDDGPWPTWEGDGKSAAKWVLEELFADFPFDGEASRANALALFLLPFVRSVIDGPTPMHFVDAPKSGSGKSLLVKAALYPATAYEAAATPLPDDEAERAKTLFAMLSQGDQVIFFDNVRGKVNSKALEACLTSTEYKARTLGVTEAPTVAVRAIFALTANNGQMTIDAARRCVWIRIDTLAENPEDRTGFRHDPIMRWIKENRLKLVSAAIAMAREWVKAGSPDGAKRKATYEAYSAVLGGCLEVCGVPGFLANDKDLKASVASDEDEWRPFYEAWREQFGEQPVTNKELLQMAESKDLLGTVIANAKNEQGKATKLGGGLNAHVGVTLDGFRVARVTTQRGASRFKLIPCGDHGDPYKIETQAGIRDLFTSTGDTHETHTEIWSDKGHQGHHQVQNSGDPSKNVSGFDPYADEEMEL